MGEAFYSDEDRCWYVPVAGELFENPDPQAVESARVELKDGQLWITEAAVTGPVSKCCGAPLRDHEGEEGTQWATCAECKRPIEDRTQILEQQVEVQRKQLVELRAVEGAARDVLRAWHAGALTNDMGDALAQLERAIEAS